MAHQIRAFGASIHADKLAFFAFFFIGLAAIWVIDSSNGDKVLAIVICSGLMVTYLVAALTIPGLRLRSDQVADNLYYLGLLYTLASLAFALFRFSMTELATDAIVRNFGIAIFTTIVGLGLRVGVGQFREDPEDIEAEAKVALSQAVHRMRTELDRSTAELQSFADGMRQVVGDFATSANKTTIKALEQAVGRFEKAAETMGLRLENTAVGIESRAGAFDGSVDRLVGTLEALSNRIEAVKADSNIVEETLRPAMDAIVGSATGFAATMDRERERYEQGAEGVFRMADAAERLDGAMSSLTSASTALGGAAEVVGGISSLVDQLRSVTDSAADATARFDSRLSNLAAETERTASDAIGRLQQASADAVARAQHESEQRLAAMEQAAGRIGQTLDKLDRDFASSGETVARVRRELAELAGWIVQRLEKA